MKKRKITEIIVHCTDTPAGRDVSVTDVNRCHRQRGFSCIGYHWLVGLDGEIRAGRDESVQGAHCVGHNAQSIGVCYVGGRDRSGRPADTRTSAQKSALRRLIADLLSRYPEATVHGHREFAAKACPCFEAAAEYAVLSGKGDK